MNHVRIATYDVTHGTAKDVAEVAMGPGGTREIFMAQPGFQAFSLIEVDPVTIISITVWETHEEAEAATREAATFVAEHLDGRLHRTSNLVGDAMFWEGIAK
jgi:heme-degrading monooxygenase HmoA